MAAGLCLGVLMLAVGLGSEAYPSLRRVFDGIHAPANWAAQLWSNGFGLPPRGETAFATDGIGPPVVIAAARFGGSFRPAADRRHPAPTASAVGEFSFVSKRAPLFSIA